MAVTSAMEVIDGQRGGIEALSPLFHYFQARPRRDRLSDVTLRAALDAAMHPGVCMLPLHNPPMTRSGALQKPSARANDDASARSVVGYDPNLGRARYYSLDAGDRVENWRAALQSGYAIIFGFWTTSQYWRGEGVLEPPPERSNSAHAVMAYGYRDDYEYSLVHDSRGTGFARDGKWPLAYGAAQSRLLIESWCIEAITYDD